MCMWLVLHFVSFLVRKAHMFLCVDLKTELTAFSKGVLEGSGSEVACQMAFRAFEFGLVQYTGAQSKLLLS